jgi:hypothetical protein
MIKQSLIPKQNQNDLLIDVYDGADEVNKRLASFINMETPQADIVVKKVIDMMTRASNRLES